jgi:Family of unknown function (DUF6518)
VRHPQSRALSSATVNVVLAIVLAASLGAGDQYLGSLSAHPWAADVSLLSAPWLVLAFVAGWSQREPRRAVLLGFACTFAALLGYGLMTLSPVEHAQLTTQTIRGFLVSERRVIVGAVFTGPLFGWFGYRWRAQRAWVGALTVGGAVCLEPLAHAVVGNAIRIAAVSIAEVTVGVAMILYVGTAVVAKHVHEHRG